MTEPVLFLHQFFEKHADTIPDACAISGVNVSYTYKEAEEISNKISRFLKSKGIVSGDLIGFYFNKSEIAILTMLGILKSGAGYVPIDPVYPEDRIRHIISDASLKLLLTEQDLITSGQMTFPVETILLDNELTSITGKYDKRRLTIDETNINNTHLSYIIYTSGSTGKPKGVMTEHRNIVSFVNSFKSVCRLTQDDRVYQGFSFGFDGSVEEIWMAFAHGATLITSNNEIARIPADTAQYLTTAKATYFSTVPTFLSMIPENLPTIKTLVVSGEACPQELVNKWATPNRRMLNVYGPTEATVNTTVAECKQGKKVTIGKPIDGYDIFILDENMSVVDPGMQGELYIGGPGLSRGYMNLPELTHKTFIPAPSHLTTTSSRIYKTGDLVALNEENELYFYGRIDSQVKIRGYRIELSEIESVLREHPQIKAAAVKPCTHNNTTDLAAFIVTHDQAVPDRESVLMHLKAKLPAYMIPSYLDCVISIPTLSSGKTDRKQLPDPQTPLLLLSKCVIEPSNELESELLNIWKSIFNIATISTDDNFFTNLGGYSLIAAQLVTLLRKSFGNEITIRDIYQYPTIHDLAIHIQALQSKKSADTIAPPSKSSSSSVFKSQSFLKRFVCIGLQIFSLCGIYSTLTLLALLSIVLYNDVHRGTFDFISVTALSVILFFLAYPTVLLFSILLKWLVIGRYKPGNYPVYSFYYFRWWLVTRVQRLSGYSFLSGTPLINVYFRLMGAKIGKNCVINTSFFSIFDLLTIGDNTSIGFESQSPGYRVENGMLTIGSVYLGSDCFVGIQSSLGLNTRMDDKARLDDLSHLSDGDHIKESEYRQGSPSRKAPVSVPTKPESSKTPVISRFIFTFFSIINIYILEFFLVIAAAPSVTILYMAFDKNSWIWWISLLLISVPLFEITFWTMMIVSKYLILPNTKPGIYPVSSFIYLRKWLIDSLLGLSRLLTLPIYTTLYVIPLLKLLGIKIGKRAELSVLSYIAPDLVELGSESFFADGSVIGGIRINQGWFELARNKIGNRSFIGNSAVLPTGKNVGDNCLIGVLSIPPQRDMNCPDGSEWLGSPSFSLPYRKKVEGFGENVIYKPSPKMFAARLCIDALRIIIPSCIEIFGIIGILMGTWYAYNHFTLFQLLISLPVIGFGMAMLMSLCVVLVKNILIGTYKPVIKPLWSPYVWINEVVNGVYESVFAPLLSPLLGTPFFASFLRLLGVKIGKNVFIETTLFGEFDLVDIGDFAALNVDVIVQNHLFEDRVFKSSYLKIGPECSIGNMTVVLYDTEMAQGSSITSLSLLMKGEKIPPYSTWEGIPLKQAAIQTNQDMAI